MLLSHHTLIAWQRADDLFIKLHQFSLKAFPAFERFESDSQLRRAAFSVAVNIVEGFARPKGKASATASTLHRDLGTSGKSLQASSKRKSSRSVRHWQASFDQNVFR